MSSQMEITSNNEAVIEGCKGILEYDDVMIKLNLGKLNVRFTGENLRIRCMNVDNVIVSGFITSIEFLT